MRTSWGPRPFVVIVGVTVGLALPGVAVANVYCVNDPACVTAGGVNEGSEGAGLQKALTSAAAHADSGGPDSVVIGPGSYSRSAGFVYSGDPVAIDGAGRGVTTLTDTEKSSTVLALTTTAGSIPSVADLTIKEPNHESDSGLLLNGGLVERVAIEGGGFEGIGLSTGMDIVAGVFSHGSVVMSETGSSQAAEGHGGEILDSTLKGGYALQAGGVMRIRGSVLAGTSDVLDAYNSTTTIEDSVVDQLGRNITGLLFAADAEGAKATALLRGVTIVNGGGSSAGIEEYAYNAKAATDQVAVTLQNSIIGQETHPIVQRTEDPGASAVSTEEYSSFDAASDTAAEIGGGVTPVSADLNGVSSSPDFAAPVYGAGSFTAENWRLAAASPLIDAGTPGALAEGEYASDMAGQPRVSDGRRDVGAFELQWPVVTTAGATPSSAAVGQTITFSGSASAPEFGDSILSYAWTFDDGSAVPGAGATATATHVFTTPGLHTATLTARDALGLPAFGSTQVDVLVGKALPPTPMLGGLKVSPSSFHAARSGGSLGKGHAGTRVGYTAAKGLKVTFTIKRRATGVKVGHSCVAPRRGRHGKTCTRLVLQPGLFGRTSTAGANAFRFSGRLKHGALVAGSYVLVATWTQEGHSEHASVSFRILS